MSEHENDVDKEGDRGEDIQSTASPTTETYTDPFTFKAYSSIETHKSEKYIDYIRERGYGDAKIEWQASEKIHGANFIIMYDGTRVAYCRRNAMLTPQEPFFAYKTITPQLEQQTHRVFLKIKETQPDLTTIHLYGELFGGCYNHPSVAQVRDVKHVQADIDYSPNLHYHVFDILCNRQHYLDCNTLASVCEACQVPYAKALHCGTLDEMLALPVENQITTIPSYYNLPPIENNYWEGLVIRPVMPLYCGNGARVMIKKKTKKFTEVKVKNKVTRQQVQKQNLSAHVQVVLGVAANYVCRARLATVLSKYDVSTASDLGKHIVPMFTTDVMSALQHDFPTLIPTAEMRTVTRHVSKLCADYIQTYRWEILGKKFKIEEEEKEEKEPEGKQGHEGHTLGKHNHETTTTHVDIMTTSTALLEVQDHGTPTTEVTTAPVAIDDR